MTFKELQLLPQLLKAVDELGYTEPSPIQAAAIPPVAKGCDLIGCAQTGTGKTAAFAIPILQRLNSRVTKTHHPIRVLVLTPTRELALQIKESFDLYGKYLPIRNTVIFGGVGQTPQVHDVRKVIARLPEKRQTLLFSATMPQEIAELSQKILRNPVRVEVTPQSSTVDAIEQRLYKVDKGNKKHLLQHVLEDRSLDSVLVFTNTKHGADRVVKELGRAGITAMAIHGNKGQTARVKALESFKSGTIRVLVATDIAARGIDVNELAAVVNYELPNVPETYVHRIGRTGRAGRSGVAISFCNFDELAYLKDIEKLTRKRVPVVEGHPWPMEILEATPKTPRQPRPARGTRGAAAPQRAVEKAPAPLPPKPAFPAKRARPEPPVPAVQIPSVPAPPMPEPARREPRRIASEPPRMGRLVAFADGRKPRRSRRPKG